MRWPGQRPHGPAPARPHTGHCSGTSSIERPNEAKSPRAMPAQGRQRQQRSTRLSARQLDWQRLRSLSTRAYCCHGRTARRHKASAALRTSRPIGTARLSAPPLVLAMPTVNGHAGKLNGRAPRRGGVPTAGRRVALAAARGDTASLYHRRPVGVCGLPVVLGKAGVRRQS